MQTRSGSLAPPQSTTATAPWTKSGTAVYPSGSTYAAAGPWDVSSPFLTPNLSGVDDDAWTDDGAGTLTPNVSAAVGLPVVETPTGTKNGTNRVFTLSAVPLEIIVRKGVSISTAYTISGTTLTFDVGHAPASADVLRVFFWPAASP